MKQTNPFYLSRAWRRKRLEILERDHYECVMCRAEGKATTNADAILEIDHIKELDECPDLALVDSNLQTLCKDCHNRKHERFNYRQSDNNRKWQDEWWGNPK